MALIKTAGFVANVLESLLKSRLPGASIPDIQRAWVNNTFKRFDIDLRITGKVSEQTPLILVGNHISYIDILILMAASDGLSFVAKKELKMWPIFGEAARAMDTIFVERSNTSSRQAAREAIREGLRQNRRIVIFPSGTTCLDESKPWRHGVFEIAAETGVAVQPFRLTYSPLRKAAYIDDDLFPTHLYRLARSGPVIARLEFHEPVTITDPATDSQKWQKWSQEILQKQTASEEAVSTKTTPVSSTSVG